MNWHACVEGKYQHIFLEVAEPFKFQGRLVHWRSICSRAFCFDEPIENEKLKKCEFCEEKKKDFPD